LRGDPGAKGRFREKWTAVSARPGTSPVRNLVEAIADTFKGKVGEDDYDKLISGSVTIHEWIRRILPGGQRLLLIIDQFEEIFRYKGPGRQIQIRKRLTDLSS
jgi:hypothetical protein